VELTSQSDPIYPIITERDDHLLVTMPADWSLEPLYEELAERGQKVIKEKRSNGFWRIRVTKPPPPPDEGEPAPVHVRAVAA
jgi:hypothetical protein